MTTSTARSTDPASSPTIFRPDPHGIRRLIERRSVATLATVSAGGRAHAATVLYQCVADALFVSTFRESRKARNIAETGRAAVVIAVRRIPVGPPASVQFQTTAEVLSNDDVEVRRLASAGQLKGITAHGELELPDACFLRLPLPPRALTYALGMSLWHALRHPLDVAGEVDLRLGRPMSTEPPSAVA